VCRPVPAPSLSETKPPEEKISPAESACLPYLKPAVPRPLLHHLCAKSTVLSIAHAMVCHHHGVLYISRDVYMMTAAFLLLIIYSSDGYLPPSFPICSILKKSASCCGTLDVRSMLMTLMQILSEFDARSM
jgi:hypothetical protein